MADPASSISSQKKQTFKNFFRKRHLNMDVLKNFTFFKINFKRTGLLIFRAVADPRNSGISTKSARNPNTCRQNIFNTYLGY